MAQKTRTELQQLFQTGAKPSQQDFADFIESTLNRKDDGIEKPSGEGIPLKIMAQGDDETLLDFYREQTKTWSISQKSGDEEGLNISNSSGDSKLFIDSSGNVGIGTDTPEATLDVAGPLKLSGTGTLIFHQTNESGTPTGDGFRIRYDDNFFAQSSDALVIEKVDFNGEYPDGGIAFVNTGSTGEPQTALVIRGDGNVGIGTETPDYKFHVLASSGAVGLFESSTTQAYLRFYTSEGGDKRVEIANRPGGRLALFTADGGDVLNITQPGNVGIGTTTPGAKLDVNGALKVNGSLNVNHSSVNIGGEFGTTTLTIKATNAAANPGRTTCINLIGYENRGKGLYFSDTGNDEKWFIGTGYSSREFSIGYSATGAETDYKENSKFIVKRNGNVGIGTISPEAKLSINGGLHVGGNSDPGDNNLLVDGTTTTNQLSVSESLNFGEDTRQMINLYGYGYGIGVQGRTQYFRTNNNFAWYKGGSHDNNELSPGTDGTVQMVIKDGNVGIGKTPENGHKLEISGGDLVLKLEGDDNVQDQGILFQNVGNSYTWRIYRAGPDASPSYPDLKIDGGASSSIDDLTNRMTITNDGNVGIGTTAPSAPLQVKATSQTTPDQNGLYIYNPTNSANQNAILCVRVAGTSGGDPFVSWDVSGENGWSMGIDNSDSNKLKIARYWGSLTTDTSMTFDRNGNVGIGTTTPGAKLEVNGTIKTNRLQVTTKPIQVKKYKNIGDNANYNTGYSTSDWICGIIGFHSGSGDIDEGHGGDIIKVYAYPNSSNNKWYIKSDFHTHSGDNESWTIWLMAIKKDIVEAVNTLTY